MLAGVMGVMLAEAAQPASVARGAAADSIEAPQLGRRGTLPVGTDYREIALSVRLQLTSQGIKEHSRRVGLRLWYPAAGKGNTKAAYRHVMTGIDGQRNEIVEQGAAYGGVKVAAGMFPLVVISHGLGGWSEHMSRLGEHLASRGYVVAAIDHRDAGFTDVPAFMLSFANVLNDRPRDLQEVIAQLLDPKFMKTVPPLAAVDAEKVALIGYSMGGYGALLTAGGSFDRSGNAFAQLPGAMRAALPVSDPAIAGRIKAVVTIAPWGGKPDNRAWTAGALATIGQPILIIAGDHDDAVDYRDGVRWIFDNLKSSDRSLLVYREAKHNIAGNAVALNGDASAESIAYAYEPVWRLERINQVNQHFVTAFLDSRLKGETAAARFLDLPVSLARDGVWPLAFGTLTKGAFAGDDQPGYWRGFQRGSATGLEFHRKPVGQ